MSAYQIVLKPELSEFQPLFLPPPAAIAKTTGGCKLTLASAVRAASTDTERKIVYLGELGTQIYFHAWVKGYKVCILHL